MKELDGTYVGFILDGTDDTPDQAVMLTIGFDSIVIEMPLVDGATDVYEKAWFKDRTIPEELVFKNQDESFSLLHLRLSHSSASIGRGYGVGRLEAGGLVVTGSRTPSYQNIHGLQSELAGLPAWIAPDVFSSEVVPDEDGRTSRAYPQWRRLRRPIAIRSLGAAGGSGGHEQRGEDGEGG
jgi:hypothetical protein